MASCQLGNHGGSSDSIAVRVQGRAERRLAVCAHLAGIGVEHRLTEFLVEVAVGFNLVFECLLRYAEVIAAFGQAIFPRRFEVQESR